MLFLLTFALLVGLATAIFQDEAGQLDFIIQSTGHGAVRQAFVVSNGRVVTTDGDDSCYMACRSVGDGALLWRRNICSTTSSGKHLVTSDDKHVVTADTTSGILRSWDATFGALHWDVSLAKEVHDLWAFQKDSVSYVAVSQGEEDLVIYDTASGTPIEPSEVSPQEAFSLKPSAESPLHANCEESKMYLAVDPERKSLTANGANEKFDAGLTEEDKILFVKLLECDPDAASVLVSSVRGETKKLSFNKDDVTIGWSAEEGLGMLSSAILLDDAGALDDLDEEKQMHLLDFSERLASQWQSLSRLIASPDFQGSSESETFGFAKIAILLSQSLNRLFGLETIGPDRGELRYRIDLPDDNVVWHRLVQGAPHGQVVHHSGLHHHFHDALVLSLSQQREEDPMLYWTCLDVPSGQVNAKGFISLPSRVAQVIPMEVTEAKCRQAAALLLDDGSVVSIPDDTAALAQEVNRAPNGFYTHKLSNSPEGKLESYMLSADDDGKLNSLLTASLVFPGERIVTIGYPWRDEVIESPCSVLGDDSLLIKYMNPHLVVLITYSDDGGSGGEFKDAFKSSKTQKRKPAGAGGAQQQEPSASDDEPNLFVNVVDSVSGLVLYRVGHANAALNPTPSIVVSENWVFYTFMNGKTRRAEVGVLSLYEGMIDSKGLTAFSSPERSTKFSSLDVRESPKPVVLAKTYSIAKPVTALGVTSTRSGISSRRLVMAGIDGLLYAVDRKILEPRRPVGELKDTEKKEGLVQYSELIPRISYMALSYNQTVESVKGIVTAPTGLESQSLVLAFGGPDLFFARTSPSRGFDLLPVSFNRILIAICVAVMIVVNVVLRRMVDKKMRKAGWM